MTNGPTLSGRTGKSLQAEADLVLGREELEYAEQYLAEAKALHVILVSMRNAFADHSRFIERAPDDAARDVMYAEDQVARARERLQRAETEWAEQEKP